MKNQLKEMRTNEHRISLHVSSLIPQKRDRRHFPLSLILFWVFVILPVATSAAYYLLVASDRYVTESQFIVRSISTKRISGLDTILKSIGMASTQDDANAVINYLTSRDAIRELEERLPIRVIFSRPDADFVARFPSFWSTSSFESLYYYFQTRVSAVRDSQTGITTLRVSTFKAEDSKVLATTLLELSERLVNRMNDRAQRDSIKGAESEIARAQYELISAQERLTNYRNQALIFDPSASSNQGLQMVASLSTELAINQAEISEAGILSPNNPSLSSLRARSDTLKQQISAEKLKLAGTDTSLAQKVGDFERLVMEREFAERRLTSAMTSLEAARQDARRQQVYIEQIVQASVPDEAIEPRRMRSVVSTAFVSVIVFGLAWILFAGVKEHADG